MKKVVVLLLTVLFVFAGCDGNMEPSTGGEAIDPSIPGEPVEPDNPDVSDPSEEPSSPSGPGFSGDLSFIGVDNTGYIKFSNSNEMYDFSDKYLSYELQDVSVSVVSFSQDMMPEYLAQYEEEEDAIYDWYSNERYKLGDLKETGEITSTEYYSKYQDLQDEYNMRLATLNAEWSGRDDVWDDLRVLVIAKNNRATPVNLYIVIHQGGWIDDYHFKFYGPITLDVSGEWQNFIIRRNMDGKKYQTNWSYSTYLYEI